MIQIVPHPSGEHFFSHSADGSTRLWSVHSDQERNRFNLQDSTAFSPTKDRLYLGNDALVELDIATGQITRRFFGHQGPVWATAVSGDGQTLLSSGFDGTVRLWETASGLEVFRWDDRPCRGLAILSDGAAAVGHCESNALLMFDLVQGGTRALGTSGQGNPYGVALSPGGQFAIASETGGTFIVELATGHQPLIRGAQISAGPPRVGAFNSVVFSPEDATLITVDFTSLEIWERGKSGKPYWIGTKKPKPATQTPTFEAPIRRISMGDDWIHCVAFASDGVTLLCATGTQLCLVDLNSGEITPRRSTATPAHDLAQLPNGQLLTAHGRLVLDETGERGRLIDGAYVYEDCVVRLWQDPLL